MKDHVQVEKLEKALKEAYIRRTAAQAEFHIAPNWQEKLMQSVRKLGRKSRPALDNDSLPEQLFLKAAWSGFGLAALLAVCLMLLQLFDSPNGGQPTDPSQSIEETYYEIMLYDRGELQ